MRWTSQQVASIMGIDSKKILRRVHVALGKRFGLALPHVGPTHSAFR
jgi:hypothetical protein